MDGIVCVEKIIWEGNYSTSSLKRDLVKKKNNGVCVCDFKKRKGECVCACVEDFLKKCVWETSLENECLNGFSWLF